MQRRGFLKIEDIHSFRELAVLKAESDALTVQSNEPNCDSEKFIDEIIETLSKNNEEHQKDLNAELEHKLFSLDPLQLTSKVSINSFNIDSDSSDSGISEELDEYAIIDVPKKTTPFEARFHSKTLTLHCPSKFANDLEDIVKPEHVTRKTLRQCLLEFKSNLERKRMENKYTPIADQLKSTIGIYDKFPAIIDRLEHISLGQTTFRSLLRA
ncbi:MAG: hypothetical protein HAW66_00620 [Shewanella sp.]|nr:hypothetical protein [Shewanella sp.]